MQNLDVGDMTTLLTEGERRHEFEKMTRYEIRALNELLQYHRNNWMEFNVVQPALQFGDARQPSFPHHGPHVHSNDARLPENQLRRNPMVALVMPQAERIRRDSIASMGHRTVNDQQLVRRGSLRGQQGKARFLPLVFHRANPTRSSKSGFREHYRQSSSYHSHRLPTPRTFSRVSQRQWTYATTRLLKFHSEQSC